MSKDEIREVNGVKYVVKHCPKCNNELLFRVREQAIRIHGACAKCGAPFEVLIENKF